jgi:hypothetical protein
MAALTAADAASRMGSMAKKGWIKKAVSGAPGAFRKKAEAAGESTREFASEKKDAPGKTGKQARLASTLMGLSGHSRGKSKLYKD